jgi:hypothetical protein
MIDNYDELQLRERDVIPTSEVLEQVLGDNFFLYEIFQATLPDLEIEQNWQWYTPHKSWYAKGQYFWTTQRGTKKEKNLYWLYIYRSYFVIAVWFKEKNRDEVLKADVSDKTKQLILNAKTEMGLPTFPIMFKITNTNSFNDIYKLLEYKKSIELD